MINPGVNSVFVTCFYNKGYCGDIMFEINDGCQHFPRNYNIQTESMEVIITRFMERGILPLNTGRGE